MRVVPTILLLLLLLVSCLAGVALGAEHDLYCDVDSLADLSTIPHGDVFRVHSHSLYGEANYKKRRSCSVVIKVHTY